MRKGKLRTIQTYREGAQALAEKFNQFSRISDIEETFALLNEQNPFVLEIGCGNGRDARDILRKTDRYIGMDISEELIAIARKDNPQCEFVVADIETYEFPEEIDAIFAFASLIHVPKDEFEKILARAFIVLRPGGAFRISMKHAPEYKETTKTDEFGTRTYYLYAESDIREAAQGYSILKCELNELRGQTWLEILLQQPIA